MKTKLVCEECGSDQVETLAWIDANTGEFKGNSGEEYDSDFNWCKRCGDYVVLIGEDEYIKRKEEENEN